MSIRCGHKTNQVIKKHLSKPIDKNNHNQLAKVGARALAALQHGVDPNGQQQFLVYPAMGKQQINDKTIINVLIRWFANVDLV